MSWEDRVERRLRASFEVLVIKAESGALDPHNAYDYHINSEVAPP